MKHWSERGRLGRVAYVLYSTAYGTAYGTLMRLAHRFNWHHTKICHPDGDTLVWCQWCGLRDVVHRGREPMAIDNDPQKAQVALPDNYEPKRR